METKDKEAIIKVAKEFNIEPAAFLAVKQVETGNTSGFMSDGRPVILFEGHIFYKYYNSRHPETDIQYMLKNYPYIYYPKWTKDFYGTASREHERLELAQELDSEVANMSASWGLMQIMGFNYDKCGCHTVREFVNKMQLGREEQVRLAATFLKNSNLIDVLNQHNWAKFAKKYNGPGQVDYYSQKLTNAYTNFKRSLA
jgi:hypothetical protein